MIEYELVKADDEEPKRKLRQERTREETLRRLIELGYHWDKDGEPDWDEEEGLWLPEDIEAGDERPEGKFVFQQNDMPEAGGPDDMSWHLQGQGNEPMGNGFEEPSPTGNGHGYQSTGEMQDMLSPESEKWRNLKPPEDTPPSNPPVPPVINMLLKAFRLRG